MDDMRLEVAQQLLGEYVREEVHKSEYEEVEVDESENDLLVMVK